MALTTFSICNFLQRGYANMALTTFFNLQLPTERIVCIHICTTNTHLNYHIILKILFSICCTKRGGVRERKKREGKKGGRSTTWSLVISSVWFVKHTHAEHFPNKWGRSIPSFHPLLHSSPPSIQDWWLWSRSHVWKRLTELHKEYSLIRQKRTARPGSCAWADLEFKPHRYSCHNRSWMDVYVCVIHHSTY